MNQEKEIPPLGRKHGKSADRARPLEQNITKSNDEQLHTLGSQRRPMSRRSGREVVRRAPSPS